MVWIILGIVTIIISIFFITLSSYYISKNKTPNTNVKNDDIVTLADNIVNFILNVSVFLLFIIILITPVLNLVASFCIMIQSNKDYKDYLKSSYEFQLSDNEKFNILTKILISQNILTKKQINEYIDAYRMADKLSKS